MAQPGCLVMVVELRETLQPFYKEKRQWRGCEGRGMKGHGVEPRA